MKTLDSYNFENKVVLLRTDINSDVPEGKNKIIESERIRESCLTINELKKKKAKVIVLAHQGKKGKHDFTSLEQHALFLNKYTRIKFVNDIIGNKARNAIENLNSGEAILLDNLRMVDDEVNLSNKKNKLVDFFAPLADYYVNDAFSVCHREQASITLLPKKIKNCVGRVLEREVKALGKIKLKNCLYILGGAKPEDNIKLLKGNKVLAGGLFGQVCLIAQGKNLGFQNNFLKQFGMNEKLLYNIRKRMSKTRVITPKDFALKINGKRKELSLEEFPSNYEIFDIGSKTIDAFINEINKSKSIYMKGPVGYATEKQFALGTEKILKAISESKAFSVIGGGHLSDAIKKSKINKNKFSHISLSGGALLNYMAGEKLPGLVALGIK